MTSLTRTRLITVAIGAATCVVTGAWYDAANDLPVLSPSTWLPTSPGELLGLGMFLTYDLMPFVALAVGGRKLGRATPLAALACAAWAAEGTRETLNSTSPLAGIPMLMAPLGATFTAAIMIAIAASLGRGEEC